MIVTPESNETFGWFQKNILNSIFTDWSISRRVSKMEYQYALVTLRILWLAVWILSWVIWVTIIDTVFSIFVMVAQIKLAICRIKDRGRNPWNLLWLLVPIVGLFTAIRLFFYRWQEWANEHGPDGDSTYKKANGVKWYYGWILVFILIFLLWYSMNLWYNAYNWISESPEFKGSMLEQLKK